MRDFVQGFIKGARETPVAYFAPAIAIWRLLLGATESLLNRGGGKAKVGN